MKGAASCCGVLTLQVGASILSVLFLTLAGLILVVNVFDYYNDLESGFPVNLIVVTIFVILLALTGFFMFLAAYNERKKWALIAMLLSVVILFLWLVLSILSVVNSSTILKHLCVHERCPESTWLVDLKYRGNWRVCNSTIIAASGTVDNGKKTELDKTTSRPPPPQTKTTGKTTEAVTKAPQRSPKSSNQRTSSMPHRPDNWQEFLRTYSPAPKNKRSVDHNIQHPMAENGEEAEPTYVMGVPLVGAVIIFIAYLTFFVFAAFIMWSYYKELSLMMPVDERESSYS